ncbi:NAD(P)/FAD-dependent oxidoreductase [Bradyrhizobium sp. JYMT SZCCT0428]|uniref:NAD(P)/FAD-dependent oxidoreductase n=1 Tax=Bradyrhizobium sp. JYMT SZCCT0428 TaxID=2807673 RepID=UPI001BAC06A8|nr:FAD-dependent monooxygenase [Bradyrhizobium sp. JYMT SZCCT0428]MBR1156755.1 FAD-dependent monooxygenase [Bradyrhizobium sp. JYMT SZCCT0428]
MRHAEPDVVIVGAGIAGGALGTVLAGAGFEVVLLEREKSYPDRVRGEFMAPWGVTELAKLELLQPLRDASALFTRRSVPYDENFAPAEAEARGLDLTKMHSEGLGGLCLGHPATCAIFAQLATAAGAILLRGAGDISVTSGSRPLVSCTYDGAKFEFQPRLVIGADGRNSSVRKELGFKVNADEPRNLLGGMLVKGVPSWPRDMQVIGVEDRFHFLIFPQGDDLLRLYGSYHFAEKARFDGPTRRAKLIDAFSKLSCVPYAEAIAASIPIGPFNSFSNEDHWIDDPTCPGTVLIGDAAGHNDPIIGQGLSIALRDVRLVSEILRDAKTGRRGPDFRPYVEERAERMRRLRITAQVVTTLRVEFGPEERKRRARVGKRVAEGQLAPLPASLIGPERLPPEAFLPETIERLLAP